MALGCSGWAEGQQLSRVEATTRLLMSIRLSTVAQGAAAPAHINGLSPLLSAKAMCETVEFAEALNVTKQSLVQVVHFLQQVWGRRGVAEPRYPRHPLIPGEVAHPCGAHRPCQYKQLHITRVYLHVLAPAHRFPNYMRAS
eukprot:scaffold88241_cov32-Tisochrysis_lutea.AAC.2